MHDNSVKFDTFYINVILTRRKKVLFCGYFCGYRWQKLEFSDCKLQFV